jgi:hypothetical protein
MPAKYIYGEERDAEKESLIAEGYLSCSWRNLFIRNTILFVPMFVLFSILTANSRIISKVPNAGDNKWIIIFASFISLQFIINLLWLNLYSIRIKKLLFRIGFVVLLVYSFFTGFFMLLA